MAHHRRKRPKHRRSGCLLCKPHKLPAKAKAERRKARDDWIRHEQVACDADIEAAAIAAERIRTGAADQKEDGANALAKLGIELPQR